MRYIEQNSPTFWKVNVALFLGGFVTFATLYATQPLLTTFSAEFHVEPAVASLSLSLTTLTLAISMLLAATLSESWGRKPIMTVSLVGSSILTILAAFSPTFGTLLVLRAAMGIVLAGLPAIAMAYLGEEMDPSSLGFAMGLYISGNSVGGMSGRIITSILTDLFSWRVALGSIGLLSLIASLWFWISLPPSQNFRPHKQSLSQLFTPLGRHLRDEGLLRLFTMGFVLLGSFVALYNYIGYMLVRPPYNLSRTLVGFIFVVYLVGTFSSVWMGRLADRVGRRKVLWLAVSIMLAGAWITLVTPLALKILGVAVFTFGFFGGHSIASSWVGRRALRDKAHASSLYLLFYYAGSSVAGSLGGIFWSGYGWVGVVGMITVLLVVALILSARLSTIAPATATQQAQH